MRVVAIRLTLAIASLALTTTAALVGQPPAGLSLSDQGITFPDGSFLATASGSYAQVIVVAKQGGHYVTIGEALEAAADASASRPYLILVAPGEYYEQLSMRPYVDIQGSGELTTRITFEGDPWFESPTIAGADDAELRFLTVENTGGSEYAIAIRNNEVSPRLTHVTASAFGATHNHAITNKASAPELTDVHAFAQGGAGSTGVTNLDGASPVLRRVTASGSDAAYNNTGIHNHYSSPTITDSKATASGGTLTAGVKNTNSSPVLRRVVASAVASGLCFGVINETSSPTLLDVEAAASGACQGFGVVDHSSSNSTLIRGTATAAGTGTKNYAVDSADSTTKIHSSNLTATGASSSNHALNISNTSVVSVALSQLNGTIGDLGILSCVGSYDSEFRALDENCQLPATGG